VLLISLAATSIIGTLIPQNQSHDAYFHAYGEFLFNLFIKFDIFDMYHSWWFQLLLLMLGINITVCSIDRLQLVWKTIFVRHPKFNVDRFRRLKNKETFTATATADKLKNQFLPVISKTFGYTRIEDTDKGARVFAERHRWTRLGVYVVHLSVLLLLAGSLLGSILGFDAFVNIPEGDTVNSVHLRNSNRERALPFDIRCDDFSVTFYENGAPKEYKSRLTILENGNPVLKKDIIVNDPLRYKGINIFQSSYGKLPSAMGHKGKPFFSGKDSEDITIIFKSSESGMEYDKTMKTGDTVDLPEGLGKFTISEYRESAEFRGHNIGEALVGMLTPVSGEPVTVLLPLRFPSFDKMRGGKVIISVATHDHDHDHESPGPDKNSADRYYTGLQVTKDPGVWVVYSGFILMIVGCVITFFMSHQRICVEIEANKKKTSVTVAGSSNKNRFAMENKIKKLTATLEKLADQA